MVIYTYTSSRQRHSKRNIHMQYQHKLNTKIMEKYAKVIIFKVNCVDLFTLKRSLKKLISVVAYCT